MTGGLSRNLRVSGGSLRSRPDTAVRGPALGELFASQDADGSLKLPGVEGRSSINPNNNNCTSAAPHKSHHLERRPSSLGLDHGWCVYSKPAEPCRLWPPLLKQPKRQFLCSHTKKHANGVHIISPMFTSFSRCSHRFSPPWTIRALLKGYTHTHKHVRTYSYAPTRDTSSLKTAPRPLPT
jgi:hypothetical protein